MNRRILAILLVMAIPVVFSACSDDGGGTADSGDTPDAVDSADDVRAQTEWADTFYRIETIEIIQPVGVGGILQAIIQRQIDKGLSHLLIEVFDFSATTGDATFQVRAGAGELVGTDSYAFVDEPPAPGNATVMADGSFATDDPILLDFPILLNVDPRCDGGLCPDGCRDDNDCPMTGDFECDSENTGRCIQFVVVPLNELTFEGEFELAGDTAILDQTDLEGAILKTDADEVFVELSAGSDPISLTELLRPERMDYPEGSEAPTGWKLTIVIDAVEVTPAE